MNDETRWHWLKVDLSWGLIGARECGSMVPILSGAMTMTDFPAERELVLDRLLQAPREAILRCWTEAHLLRRWFVPAPWTIADAVVDPRPGGAFDVTMRSPEGADMPHHGVFLDVVANERIVTTDAFTAGFVPRDGAPFMVATMTFADEDGGTRYIARARHWTAETRDQHAAMGFEPGWNQCADQLEALAASL
ncbi:MULTISPECIES: SRPBCC family protein [unclassified Sphingomonas]|uniref:SRPBCC family protein n=1 Tax=unclassified Sphingomonas TaxID=196159 RepID=UPI001F2BF6CE|nr:MULTISPECIES: SRPBCC family protein [unclassified Sphingomonas]